MKKTDSSEGKRNRKTQTLSALLSASALGLFLEGCGGADEPSSGGAGGGDAPVAPGGGGRSNINPILATSAVEAHVGGGDTGIDTVSYANSESPVIVSLSANIGTRGDAQGDTFENIENLIGSDYTDTLLGDDEPNTLEGGRGSDVLVGGAGNDTLYGGTDNDILYGDDKSILVRAGGNDVLYGDAGDDTLNGGVGNDVLYGGAGNDTLYGGAGNDTLYGGVGNDTLYGGAGTDTYYYAKGDGMDTATDVAGDDIIVRFSGFSKTEYDRSEVTRDTNNLVITLDNNHRITLNDAYYTDDSGTGRLAFTINAEGYNALEDQYYPLDDTWSMLA